MFWLYLSWVLANSVGGALGGAIIQVMGLSGGWLFGIPGGLAQWLVLRRYLRVSPWWAVATAVGGFLGWAAIPLDVGVILVLGYLIGVATRAVFGAQADDGVQLSPFLTDVVGLLYLAAASAVAGAITGAVVGVAQHLSLPPGLARIYFLVPAGLVGAAGGAIVAASQELSLPVPLRPPVRWVRLSAVAGFLAAATAGLDLFGRALGRSIAATGPSLAFPSASTAFPLFPSGLTSGLAFGAIDGITTGFALVRWLREGPGR